MSEDDQVAEPGKRPQFGARFLRDKKNIFKHNAWDNVVWDEQQEATAKAKVQENSEVTLTREEIERLEAEAATQWDTFYNIHQNRFFKDRHWLFTEFPELAPHLAHTFPKKIQPGDQDQDGNETVQDHSENGEEGIGETIASVPKSEEASSAENSNTKTVISLSAENEAENSKPEEDSTPLANAVKPNRDNESFPGENSNYRILEVGCGVGNTVFPILKINNDPGLFVYCCDFSSTAIDIVKETQDYEKDRCRAFVSDITSEDWGAPFPKNSLDVIVCIFVLSAINPDKFQQTVQAMSDYLRPGGLILFRDYGRYDLAQLRFKKGRCLDENFYARGDGTRCYFFTQDDIRKLMTDAGLEEVQNLVDRRLQVNRGKQLTMYRVWVQAKYRKPQTKE